MFCLAGFYISEASMSPEGLSYLSRATQQDRHSRTLTFESMLWFSEDSGSGFSKRQHEHSATWQARNVVSLREKAQVHGQRLCRQPQL